MFRFPVDEGLELRLFEERHAESLFALIDENRAHLRAWMPWVDSTVSAADTLEYVKRSLKQFADQNGFQAGIWYADELAGAVGFHYFDMTAKRTEIGYWLGTRFEGKGIMTRTCRALTQFAFDEMKLNRIDIRCAPDNTRSRAVPERLGFTQEGIMKDALWLYDHHQDMVIYRMLAREWAG